MNKNSRQHFGLSASQSAYALSRSIAADSARPWLVVCGQRSDADKLFEDLRFFFAKSETEVLFFSRWEVLPFDTLSPAPEVMGERIATLFALRQSRRCIVVTTVDALMQRVISPQLLDQMVVSLRVGQELQRDVFVEQLTALGYARSSVVEEFGQVAARGSVIDLFSPQSLFPLRVELFGDEIESIRFFDSQSQRSKESITSFAVLPAREFAYSASSAQNYDAMFTDAVKARAEQLGLPSRKVAEVVEALEQHLHFDGTEHLLPLLPDVCVSLLDVLNDQVHLAIVDSIAVGQAADSFANLVQDRAYKAKESGQLFVEPKLAFLSADEVTAALDELAVDRFEPVSLLEMEELPQDEGRAFYNNSLLQAELIRQRRSERPFLPLMELLQGALRRGERVGLVTNSKSRRNRLEQMLHDYNISSVFYDDSFATWLESAPHHSVALFYGELSSGFRAVRDSFTLIAEREIFPDVIVQGRSRLAASIKRYAGKLANLNIDDFIVHVDHGIGIYRGLKQLRVQGVLSDFLELEYAEGTKLYLPVENIGKVQKYSATEGSAPLLHKLGGTAWVKTKRKVKQQVAALAGELLRLYAKRELSEGQSYGEADVDDLAFADTFEYEPTVDQLKAIDDVYHDLAQDRAMDRLVCGDVGYGKTEVALRAAFKVANAGKQVAVLVPTTVLADQHYKSFTERFAAFPLVVRGLSRFFTPQENKETVELLRRGKVDIVIGTHRLLQKDIVFKDLGLVIIDEEHRFGVAAKEKLKKLRAAVDILTLTATPIPRTLHMSMVGIKDLSIIETAPVDRQAIRTYLVRMDAQEETVVREAILRELGRNGQVFYIHNRVQSIAGITNELRELVPEARIEFAHGQMNERQLEKVMHRFINKEFDVLVATTIVESGLDIPNANTMIIRNAERFGLAELYQLRGRVGRSARRAYAYLLVGNPAAMTKDAKKRLEVLQALDDLGIGFRLALQDMEIRGAGNLLGKDQSGHISLVGFDLYMRLLQETIESLRGEQGGDVALDIEPEMTLGFAAHIPQYYIPDVAERIFLYQRLVGLRDAFDTASLAEEIEDRFGHIPEEVEHLLEVMTLRSLLRHGHVVKASRAGTRLILSFHPEARIDFNVFVRVIKKRPSDYRLVNETTVSIAMQTETVSVLELIGIISHFLEALGVSCAQFLSKKDRDEK